MQISFCNVEIQVCKISTISISYIISESYKWNFVFSLLYKSLLLHNLYNVSKFIIRISFSSYYPYPNLPMHTYTRSVI